MNPIELEVRQALRELADEGRPVPLGRPALVRVRRRRRQRAGTLTAVTVLLMAAITVPRLLAPARTTSAPEADLADRNLVAAYLTTGAEVRVLNPDTGRYRHTDLLVETVSPDLRFGAGTRSASYLENYPADDPRLGLLDIRTGAVRWLPMPAPVRNPVWSPGGHYLIAPTDDGDPSRAVLVDPARDETTMITLDLPDNLLVVRLCWSDANRLLAVTTPRDAADRSGTQDLLLFDKSGWLIRTVSVPSSWTVRCAGRQGQVLATRLVQGVPAAVVPPQVTVIDLTTGEVAPPVTLPWAGVIEPLAWRSDRSFVATTSQHQVLIVDLELDTVTPVSDLLPRNGDTVQLKPSNTVVLPAGDLIGPFPDTVTKAVF